jgi:predicted esterase
MRGTAATPASIVEFSGAAVGACGMRGTMSRRCTVPTVFLALVCVAACGDQGTGTQGEGDDSSGTSASTGGTSPGTGSSGVEDPTSGGVSQSGTTQEPGTSTSTSDTGDTGDSSESGDPTGPPIAARCGDEPPPGATLAPEIPAYEGMCPPLITGYAENVFNVLPSAIGDTEYQRRFLVIVPEDLDPNEKLPVMFMWHWLGGEAKDFYERAEAQDAVNRMRFIAVIPQGGDQGVAFQWPYTALDSEEALQAEFKFFDDMLSCVHEQFNVDKDCVSSVGVSAGALMTSQLAGGRGDRLASFLSLSGGTGGAFVKPWTAPRHKLPGMVLWGGEKDECIVIKFQETSQDLEMHLVEDGHFVVECIHNCNHSTPPFEVEEGMTAFAPLWDFMFAHPYWLEPGQSPYNSEGLPPSMPTWCAVGVGNAVPPPEPCDKNECS